MRSIRKLALLGLAVLAVCAMAASTASATTITSGGVGYTGTIVGTNLGSVTLTTNASFTTVHCSASTLHGHVTSDAGHGVITSASWTNCVGGSGATCSSPNQPAGTIVGNNLPWTVTIANTGGVAGSNGSMTVQSSPGATIVCSGATCTFGSAHVKGSLYNDTNASRPVTTNSRSQAQFNAALGYISGAGSLFCGSTSTWDGVYQFETPAGGTVTVA